MNTFDACKTLDDFEAFYPLRQLPDGAEVTRVAPSPTGMPHIGTAMQAILDKALVDQHNGVFMLRIDDTDRAREVEGAYEVILENMNWLGTIPNEGPGDISGKYGPYIQSERRPTYDAAVEYLLEKGFAYRCFCTTERLDKLRESQVAAKKMPIYDRKCRDLTEEEVKKNLALGKKFVVRMKIPDNENIIIRDEVRGDIEFQSDLLDDAVLVKSDGFPTYHLAAVVDDHFMRVTTVVRGEEWISSAPKHLLLYRFFGWQAPRFIHTVLLRDPQKRKLSKRRGDISINWFIRQGFLSSAFINFLTRVMWTHPKSKDVYPYSDFVAYMKPADLPKTGPVADMKFLEFINSAHIAALTSEQRRKELEKYLDYLVTHKKSASSTIDPEIVAVETDADMVKNMLAEVRNNPSYTESILSLKPARYSRLANMIFENGYFYDSIYQVPALEQLECNVSVEQGLKIIEQFLDMFNGDVDTLQNLMKDIAKEHGLQDKQVFMTLRLAITGQEKTPPLPEILAILGFERVQQRLGATISALEV